MSDHEIRFCEQSGTTPDTVALSALSFTSFRINSAFAFSPEPAEGLGVAWRSIDRLCEDEIRHPLQAELYEDVAIQEYFITKVPINSHCIYY